MGASRYTMYKTHWNLNYCLTVCTISSSIQVHKLTLAYPFKFVQASLSCWCTWCRLFIMFTVVHLCTCKDVVFWFHSSHNACAWSFTVAETRLQGWSVVMSPSLKKASDGWKLRKSYQYLVSAMVKLHVLSCLHCNSTFTAYLCLSFLWVFIYLFIYIFPVFPFFLAFCYSFFFFAFLSFSFFLCFFLLFSN